MNESMALRMAGSWMDGRRARHLLAAGLGIAGALLWAMQALGGWLQSHEGKWQNNDYLSVGNSTITADDLLTMVSLASLLIAGLLGLGATLLLCGRVSGRHPLLAGAWLVVLGQLFAAVLAWIPIDAFYHSTPANIVFATPLVALPLLTILLLTEGHAPTKKTGFQR
ncbi:hypothetical protein ACFVVM_29570 [Nocardia sp. NPDC058176]|uniref:hypothetical protein n=1 Tax=Nocardia sp. NPDC058176 TaxID=3346368 RepID=UPI0036D7CC9F